MRGSYGLRQAKLREDLLSFRMQVVQGSGLELRSWKFTLGRIKRARTGPNAGADRLIDVVAVRTATLRTEKEGVTCETRLLSRTSQKRILAVDEIRPFLVPKAHFLGGTAAHVNDKGTGRGALDWG